MFNKKKRILTALLDGARQLGLSPRDLSSAQEYLEHDEYGVSFDHIITQMYEYDIEITSGFYDLIVKAANEMKLSEDEYSFMKDLVRDEDKIPKPVRENIAKIIQSLGVD